MWKICLSFIVRHLTQLNEHATFLIWLLAQGKRTEDVASVTGYCRNSIYRLVRRYNQLGVDGMKDKRHERMALS